MQGGNYWNGGSDTQLDVADAIETKLKTYLVFCKQPVSVVPESGASVFNLISVVDKGIKAINASGAPLGLIIRVDDSEDPGTYSSVALTAKNVPVYVLHVRLLESDAQQYKDVFAQTSKFLDDAVSKSNINCWTTKAYIAGTTPKDAATNIVNALKTLIKP